MDINGFFSRFPELAGANKALVGACLDEAKRWIGTDVWGSFGTTSLATTQADDGQKYVAAHLIATSPLGLSTLNIPNKDGRTQYLDRFEELQSSLGIVGCLVAGGFTPALGPFF